LSFSSYQIDQNGTVSSGRSRKNQNM